MYPCPRDLNRNQERVQEVKVVQAKKIDFPDSTAFENYFGKQSGYRR